MTWSELLQVGWKGLVALIAAGGGGGVIAFGIFKVTGQQWLEQQFKKEIERLKHEQNKEIEGMRQRVQSLFSRISKIHEKEFEVLPKAWFLLHNAHGLAAHVMLRPTMRPDFAKLNEPAFEAFLSESRLSEAQRSELRAASDPGKYYAEAIFWLQFNDAQSAQIDFNNYIIEHRIFMTDELREGFRSVSNTISEALVEHKLWKQFGGHNDLISSTTKIKQLDEKINEVEQAVQKRLHYQAA